MSLPVVTFRRNRHGLYEHFYIKKAELNTYVFHEPDGPIIAAENAYEGCTFRWRDNDKYFDGYCRDALKSFQESMEIIQYDDGKNPCVFLKDSRKFIYHVRLTNFYDMIKNVSMDRGKFTSMFYFHQNDPHIQLRIAVDR